MVSYLKVTARDGETWSATKTIVLAAVLKAMNKESVSCVEQGLTVKFSLPLHVASKAFEYLLNYFQKEYGGPPVSFSLEVKAMETPWSST